MEEGITKKYQHDSLGVEEIVELLDIHKVAPFFLQDYSASLPPILAERRYLGEVGNNSLASPSFIKRALTIF